MRALLLCVRHVPEPGELAALASAGLSEDRLLELARWHRVLPLACRVLRGLPEGRRLTSRPEWTAESAGTFALNGLLQKELGELLRIFDVQGIEALTFKGPVAAASLYGDLALRPFSDLDLLIRRERVPEVRAILRDRGYRFKPDITDDWLPVYMKRRSEMLASRENPPAIVDVHWGLHVPGYSFTPETEALWQGAETVRLCGGPDVRTLGLEETLIYFAIHAAKHTWSRLVWLADLDRLIARRNPDWERIAHWMTRSSGRRRVVGVTLAAANRMLGTELPRRIENHCGSDRSIRRLVPDAIGSLLSAHEAGRERQRGRLYFRLLSPRDRAWKLLDSLAPNRRDWEYVRLPRRWGFLYYLIRPWRLLCRALGR